jgi:hypothetical protein
VPGASDSHASIRKTAPECSIPLIEDWQTENNLLERFALDAERAGLVGEKKNAQIVLLVAISAKLKRPLNLSVGGSSSAGKNHLTGTVARFIPDEDKTLLTGMSPKALMHAGEDEFQHKVVFIAEYEGASGADYAIRTMQSEQVIEWQFAESSNQGIQAKKKRVKGPASFIQATTRTTLHPENETRLLFLQVDESESQTRAINERQALEAEKRIAPCPPDLYPQWHRFLRTLGPLPVWIPFASQLAKCLPEDRIRSRRDFPKLLGLIEASAFLHQHQRGRDSDGNVTAAPRDYQIARDLFEHCYYAGPESSVGELVQAAARLGERDFSVAELIGATGWRKSKTYQVLARAEELGCTVEAETRGRYRLLRNQIEAPLNLPSKIRLTAENFRISTEGAPPHNGDSHFHVPAIPREGAGDSIHGKTENECLGGIAATDSTSEGV